MSHSTLWSGLLFGKFDRPDATRVSIHCDISSVCIERHEADGSSSLYPIHPHDLIKALASAFQASLFSDLLDSDILACAQKGEVQWLLGWRAPQKTGVWVEGSDRAFQIPLPALLMLRQHQPSAGISSHRVFALPSSERPRDPQLPLLAAPLANVSPQNGTVCWGNIPRPGQCRGSLEEDWAQFFGTRFGTHGLERRSKAFPEDIRHAYQHLEAQAAPHYPLEDLLPTGYRLEHVLKEMSG
jgi:PRTRC genetic system protein B